ncbi:T9SS type A sorting domain-containing protein [bacterium]|nr:T9SS type A sorting domain-containing protein [bacterium]
MKKLTLLSAVFLLGILLTQVGFANGTYKYSSNPHLPIRSAQTTLDAIYVPAAVPVSDVRVSMYAKVVMYSTLRITLTSPKGVQVVLKAESGNLGSTPLYGSIGSERSHLLFRDRANSWGDQPNDRPIAPETPLSQMNGVIAQGWWQIEIKDERNASINAIPQDGFLESWVLYFNEQIVEPIQPFNPAINVLWPGGGNLFGQINGVAAQFGDPNNLAQIPNDGSAQSPGSQCNYPNDPSVLVGLNGDCFPVLISGHPGALIGTEANGYPSGRFRVTITVEPTYPASPIQGLTEDIAIYFGRVPDGDLNLPLPAPPGMGDPGYKAKQYIGGWPSGQGNAVASALQGPSGAFGGVRLAACISPSPADLTGYDRVTFDDLATTQIDNGVGVPPAPAAPPIFTGDFQPMQPLSSLDGFPVDGLYYVTVYDAFNENGPLYGHIRVTYLQVEYVVGGGEVPDPERHQGFVGPLAGVEIPGEFASPVGYLSDVIGVIPPHKEHAQVQDPMLVFWSTQKMYPRDAVGTERIMAVDQNNYAPPSATHYHGPYAYPGTLDENAAVPGSFVNADVIQVPQGTYNLRVNLMQARYDDDLADNQFESPAIDVNPISISYFGDKLTQWNKYIDPQNVNAVATAVLGNGQGIGVTFSLFGVPTTKVSSVDYKFDDGTAPITPKADARISIWKTSNGFAGAPLTLVGRSTTVLEEAYVEGNWRTFPIYPVDANGNPDVAAGGSVDLPQGSYVFTLDQVSTGGILLYPYTWGAIPALTDRYWDYLFSDNFGPLGPTSSTGTMLGYLSLDNTAPPAVGWGSAQSAAQDYSNHTFPMRVNMTTLNDFSVNWVRFSSQNSPTEAIAVGQEVTPSVNITANSDQGGLTKDCNVYLGIYDAGNNLLYSDMINIANAPYNGIQGFQTLTINMAKWTPANGGIYHIKAYFTRNPDDQNPVNDLIEYDLLVQATPVIAFDDNTNRNQLNELIDVVSSRGIEPALVNLDEASLATCENSTIYFAGDMNAAADAELSAAVAKGNDVAFVYERNAEFGALVQKIDALYDIERAWTPDYSSLEIAPSAVNPNAPTVVAAPPQPTVEFPEVSSKEELVTWIASQDLTLKPTKHSFKKDGPVNEAFANALPVAKTSAYGDITFVNEFNGNLGIVYTVPSVRKQIPTEKPPVAGAFALEQNYPNPFNPSTTISYTLEKNSTVSLRIIDMLGREVATLVSQAQDAGTYTISWKGVDQSGVEVPSGSYFYRLDAIPADGGSTFTSTKKMMLSK